MQLTQAEGQLLRDQALLENARADQERFAQLFAKGATSRQQLDTQESLVRQLEGTVKVDQGTIENAKLNITYSRITAPFAGRIGLRRVDAGNIVRATDTDGLAVITRMQPISVIFSIPEDNLPRVLARLAAGEPLTVEAYDRAFRQKLAEGKVLTVDNQIDPNTGTIRVKAEFPNENGALYPNQFVNARLLVETLRDAILVPATALQRGPRGVTVFVVKADNTVAMRPVTVGVIQTGEAAIAKGLAPDETVVVEGAERLREGAKVTPKGDAGRAQEPAK